ncbi:DUF6207 family protein [Streptomyces mirabilis]|uniref:DUF6207 family protein n=1 Tax=Streptomyces mirabilis TaxID=68239 RepID=UPI0036DEA2DC
MTRMWPCRAGPWWKVAAADDETAFAVQELLAARCAIAPSRHRTTREPDVRLRFFLDPHQDADT